MSSHHVLDGGHVPSFTLQLVFVPYTLVRHSLYQDVCEWLYDGLCQYLITCLHFLEESVRSQTDA